MSHKSISFVCTSTFFCKKYILNYLLLKFKGENNLKFFIQNNDGKQPLYIIDDTEFPKEIKVKNIDHNIIENISVIKGEAAEKLYGDKGKNGVIITSNKDALTKSRIELQRKIKNWRVEVSNISFIDDKDPSKNAFKYYLSKFSSKQIMQQNKAGLEKHGITVNYSKIKRNKAGELVRLKITLS